MWYYVRYKLTNASEERTASVFMAKEKQSTTKKQAEVSFCVLASITF
jgi:hypothetical protein